VVEERHESWDHLIESFLYQSMTGTLYHVARHVGRNQLRIRTRNGMLSFVVERAALGSPAQVGRQTATGVNAHGRLPDAILLGVSVSWRDFARVFAPQSRHLPGGGSILSPQPEQ
jgi:hypothetical protein